VGVGVGRGMDRSTVPGPPGPSPLPPRGGAVAHPNTAGRGPGWASLWSLQIERMGGCGTQRGAGMKMGGGCRGWGGVRFSSGGRWRSGGTFCATSGPTAPPPPNHHPNRTSGTVPIPSSLCRSLSYRRRHIGCVKVDTHTTLIGAFIGNWNGIVVCLSFQAHRVRCWAPWVVF